MGKYSGYLICTDLDGTFIYDGDLVEKNLRAIDYYMQNGGLFTVCTGRTAGYLKKTFGERLRFNTYLVCLNGTQIYDSENDVILYNKTFEREDIEDISDFEKCCLRMNLYSKEGDYERIAEVPADENINKIVIVLRTVDETQKLRKKLIERYGNICELNQSWDTGIELLPKNSGKGMAIKWLRERLKNEVKTIIACGDYENDITMIKEADIGYAVENAIDKVKAVADKITVANNQGAIAAIIDEI